MSNFYLEESRAGTWGLDRMVEQRRKQSAVRGSVPLSKGRVGKENQFIILASDGGGGDEGRKHTHNF